MKQRLLRLLRLDVLAIVLSLLTLAVVSYSHHRTQERLNEQERIGIPEMPHPPVELKENN
tara:strand:+ start:1409 stop:1588 length:180 start_codon:yes stop_codon:yes gene_type:complete